MRSNKGSRATREGLNTVGLFRQKSMFQSCTSIFSTLVDGYDFVWSIECGDERETQKGLQDLY
jgi:hypothetical protein